jgi:hypothetical protein
MNKTKATLGTAVVAMMKEGDDLKKKDEDHAANAESGWFDRWKGRRDVDNKLTEFKAKFFALEEEVEVFKIELNLNDSNPVVPVVKLILGILFFITSILWVLQM